MEGVPESIQLMVCSENGSQQPEDRPKMWHDLEYGRDHRPHRSQRDMQNVEAGQPEYSDSYRVLELGNGPVFEGSAGGSE